jgi:hypothetical protein
MLTQVNHLFHPCCHHTGHVTTVGQLIQSRRIGEDTTVARLSHMIMGLRQSHDQQEPCLPFTRPYQSLRDFAGTVGNFSQR